MVSIEVAKITKKQEAAKFERIIKDNPSYMKFEVTVCPCGGFWQVNAETGYTDNAQEAQDMLNYLMFLAISK